MKSVNTVRTSTVMVTRWSRVKSRIDSMYSRIWTVIAPMLFVAFGLFGVNEEVWGEEYVLSDQGTSSVTLMNNLSSASNKSYTLSGPGKTLTFQVEKTSNLATGSITVKAGSTTVKTISMSDLSKNTWKSYSVDLTSFDNYKTNRSITFSASGTLAKYLRSAKVTMAQYIEDPSPATSTSSRLDCGTADINSEATSNTVTVVWCNVPAMSYKIENDANNLFSVSAANNSEAGKYNTATFTVTYKHTKAGTHTATLKITDTYGSYSKTVYLTGTTNKLQPTVTWSSNDAIFNVDDELSASNSNDLTVTLSGNSTYVTCTGNTAVMKAATSGTITITAHVAGNDIYADKDFTKDITITNLEKQHITWTQDFSRLKTTDKTKSITLNATSDSGLPVSYALVGDKTGLTLSHSGNTWTLTYSATECKNTTIVASQAGNSTYAPASNVSLPVKVIDPTKVCDANTVLVNSQVSIKSSSVTYNIDIPETMTVSFSRMKQGLLDVYLRGLSVEFYSDRNGTGTKLYTKDYSASDIDKTLSNNNIDLSSYIHAKSVKITTEATNGYYIDGVSYTHRKYCTLSTSSLAFETFPNTATSAKSFNVSYANYPIFIECSNSKFTVSPTEFGDCGDYGTQPISVSYTAGADEGEDSGVIYIKDNTGVTLKTCSLSVEISKLTQSVTSTSIQSSYNTTDRIELSAEANSGLTAFEYSASPAGVASFDGNVMTFLQSGTIAITATQPGSNVYAAASTTVNGVQVNKVTPNIETNPTVAEIKYKGSFANNQLSEGLATVTLRGVPDTKVEGTFSWTNPGQVTDAQGSHDYSVTFTPDNTGMYNSTTFTMPVTISRADGGIEMNNGEVLVKVAGINDNLNECKIDLDDLIQSKIEDAVANRAGAVSYEVISANKANAAIDGDNKFSATQAGSYTIRATQSQTDYYEEATDEFTVTVNKLTPTIVFDNTENPEYIYSGDVIEQPAYRMYNGNLIDRVVNYISSDPSINGAIHVEGTTLTARDVTAPEGSAVEVTITASTDADALYEAVSAGATHNYAVRAKRSTYFWLDGDIDATAKTLSIGETAEITYNENVDENFTISTALSYITYVHDAEHRKITVTAQKGTLVGDGEQKLTVDQQGGNLLFGRNKVYTFTVKKNVSALSLDDLTTSMNVEDTVATPYTGLANTSDAVNFSCSPEGSMKYEDGKLIALQAGKNTVTFSQSATEYWTGISVSKTITVSKKNPVVSSELSARHAWNSIIEHPFTSESGANFTVTSNNETLARYVSEEDKIYIYGTSGNVDFTFNQEATYKYNAVVDYVKHVEIFQPKNSVPFTLTEGNLNDYKGGGSGSITWNGDGVVVGRTSTWAGAGGWEAKYIILSFVGVPDKLSFDFENTSSIATQYGWHFYQSSNGSDWNLIKEYQDLLMDASGGTSSGKESNLQLDAATQYVKLEYHGNYGGRFMNVSVTERKEIAPKAATTDFDLGYNGNDPTVRTVKVDWYNVKPCTVTITGADADKFVLDEGSKTINSTLDHYGTADLIVSYKHETNSATSHTATLHIEDEDGVFADITLTGQTTPAPQTIIWRADLTPMPIEGSFQNAAMVTTGQAVTLTSDRPEIVRVVNNTTLEPVSAGTARVTATAAGNDKWAETTGYLDIEVTTLKVQYITWTDNLSNRKREDGQTVEIELTATSSADLPITYELDEAAQAFASISGNVLSLTGWGSGQVIAKQVGNEEYVAVQATKTLVSRNPNAKCRPLVGEYKEEYTLHTLAVKEIPIYGEADSVTFWAKCDWNALYGMWVAEEYNGSYHDIQEISRLGDPNITSDYQHYSFPLHRNATAVKLYTKTGATMTRTFKGVEVPLAKYLELAENTMNFSQVDKGSTKTQSFYINYSNLTGVLDVEMENKTNTQFTVLTTTVGEDCGDIGQNVRIDISCTGSTLGAENNKIIVSNKDQRLEIPVSATVVLPSQTITWEPELNVLTTDHVVLSATATSELPVSFTSGNTDIAQIAYAAGVYSLDIKKYGDVAITAHQAGNEDWSAATDKTLTFHISRVTPVIDTWPTAQVILPNTVGGATLIGGVKPEGIDGSFRWEDESLTVTRQAHTFNVLFVPTYPNYYDTVSHALEIEILKTPQTITWNRDNETEEWCASVIALDAKTDSNLPITYHSSDSTIAYHENGNLKVLKFGTVTITAEQKGDDTYAAAESVTKTITLKRNILTLPEISVTPVYVHHFLSNSTFPTEINAMAGEVEVGGTFQWKTPDMLMDNPGPNNCTAVFTPNNENLYEPKEFVMSVEVLRFAPTINHNFTTEAADYGVKISELVLNGSGSAVDGYDPGHPGIDGTFEWKTPNHVPLVRETSAILVFRPTRSDWYDEVELSIDITINSIGYIFTGDGEWGADENWAEGEAPENVEDVIIQGNVIISGEVEVGGLTIEGGSTVTLAVDGVLTVNGESADRDLYGDVNVYNNGQLILNEDAELKVNNFTLEAILGNTSTAANSGQVTGETALTIKGDAYFDLALDPSGECSRGWYDFTVPFPVDVMTGITRFDNTTHAEKTIKNEVNYAIMDFSESRHVESGYGWKKFRGVMQPGKCYTITIDDVDNVYRFKKTKTGAFNNQTEETLAYTDTELGRRGWNGLGNGTMKHIDLSTDGDIIEKVQIYNHASNSYIPADIDEFTFVVGSSYFVQAPAANSVISYSDGTKDSDYLRAPRRVAARENSEFKLKLLSESTDVEEDRLYVGASDEALDSYEIGRDLTKFGTPTDSKVAQVWVNAYGMKLCDIDMPLTNNNAQCELGLFAPQAKEYTLSVETAPEDAVLYLTYNGRAIWNLTNCPYVFDLTKGTTEGYGLRIYAVPQVTTDLEQSEFSDPSSVRKVLIDDVIYIITPEGKMYDITGKSMNY